MTSCDSEDSWVRRVRCPTFRSQRRRQLCESSIPIPPLAEQRKIAAVLGLVQRAIEQQERLIALTTELKKALLHKLFTEGLRGEPQKQTEIGPVPESWEVASWRCSLRLTTAPREMEPGKPGSQCSAFRMLWVGRLICVTSSTVYQNERSWGRCGYATVICYSSGPMACWKTRDDARCSVGNLRSAILRPILSAFALIYRKCSLNL